MMAQATLDITLNLTLVVSILVSIASTGDQAGLDSLNGTTTRTLPRMAEKM